MAINSGNFISDRFLKKEVTTKTNQFLNMNFSFDENRMNYSRSHKKNIRRFIDSKNTTIDSTISYQDFFRLKMDSLKQRGVKLSSKNRQVYYHLLAELYRRNRLKMYTGSNENHEINGGVCLIKMDFDVLTVQTFCNDGCRRSGFIFYVIDTIIKNNAGSEKILDFMGSSIPGIRYRNLGFGSHEVNYTLIRMNRLSNLMKWVKR
jgi:hypothetical protein